MTVDLMQWGPTALLTVHPLLVGSGVGTTLTLSAVLNYSCQTYASKSIALTRSHLALLTSSRKGSELKLSTVISPCQVSPICIWLFGVVRCGSFAQLTV